jgi:hypothetical protein
MSVIRFSRLRGDARGRDGGIRQELDAVVRKLNARKR